MAESNVNRRGFAKLTMAAFGGFVTGAGCTQSQNQDGQAQADDAKKGGDAKKDGGDQPKISVDPALLLAEPHVCRGVNTCKGKGKGDHQCAGQGACASVEAHSCAGQNDCKGKGGCGGYPGQNTCNAKGHCAVPLGEGTWALARKQFEQLMKDAGKKVGEAPAKG